ncbi:YceI family protein [Hymenobacter oligotrophus]|nr:YceI family protein [Hymenobacter oligotrophus]
MITKMLLMLHRRPRLRVLLLLGLTGWLLMALRPAATRYVVRPSACQLTWTGYAEVGAWAPSGTVQLRQGEFEYDGTTVRNGMFEVDLRTIAHDNAQLQQHLRGADFFAVEAFPVAVFRLGQVSNGLAAGQLTIKGVTQRVVFPVAVQRTGKELRVRGAVTLDRTQYGIRYNSRSFFADLGEQAIRNDFRLVFDVVAVAQRQPVPRHGKPTSKK